MPALRWYQRQAVDAAYDDIRKHRRNPLLSLPTGSGKSWIVAQLCSDAALRWQSRALVVAHRKELLEQNAEKIRALAPDLEVGVYSAGLGRRDTEESVLVAGVQSICQRSGKIGVELGSFDLVVIDEAHLIPGAGDGMYRRLLDELRRANPNVVFVGLTATPYRLDSGLLWGAGQLFESVTWEIGVKKLIAGGFLCPLVSRAGREIADTSGVTTRGGDFDSGELDDLMSDDRLVGAACRDIVELTSDRRKVLLFASGVQHAEKLCDTLRDLGEHAEFVSGETPRRERDRLLAEFRDGDLRYLSNCDILTTGFDAPDIDCIALLRPTQSAGLYVQMVGRGLRTHSDKSNCLVLDYGENVLRHGPIDQMATSITPAATKRDGSGEPPVKTCPGCDCLVATGLSVCPQCKHGFEEHGFRHEERASLLPPLSPDAAWHDVTSVRYVVHTKNETAAKSLRVEYAFGRNRRLSEFICVEHRGYPGRKALDWWKARSSQAFPQNASEAQWLASEGSLLEPRRILVKEAWGHRWPSIIGHDLPDLTEERALEKTAATAPF